MDADTNAGQVWYEVNLPNGLTFPPNIDTPPTTGWILARAANFVRTPSGIQSGNPSEYLYVKDGDPCGNEVRRPTGTLTFTYDRTTATNFGLAQSLQNSQLAIMTLLKKGHFAENLTRCYTTVNLYEPRFSGHIEFFQRSQLYNQKRIGKSHIGSEVWCHMLISSIVSASESPKEPGQPYLFGCGYFAF